VCVCYVKSIWQTDSAAYNLGAHLSVGDIREIG